MEVHKSLGFLHTDNFGADGIHYSIGSVCATVVWNSSQVLGNEEYRAGVVVHISRLTPSDEQTEKSENILVNFINLRSWCPLTIVPFHACSFVP